MTITQAESALGSTIMQTWKRVRSSDEINNFLLRREFALEGIGVTDEDGRPDESEPAGNEA